MSDLIIDSSVALAWLFDDESSPYADSVLALLEHQEALVTTHWPLEVTNSLLMAERRGRIVATQIRDAITVVGGLAITFDDKTGVKSWSDTLSLARAYRLTLYDAAYLELSLRKNLPLATLDKELRTACPLAGSRLV